MATESEKVKMQQRQRKRVPVSCLNCKRRKVKCDRAKPACGGCVKNGVSHLCEYVEPEWANSCNEKEDSKASTSSRISVEETEEYKQLMSQHEKVISSQRKEIEDLKRQLSVVQQLTPKVQSEKMDSSSKPITILNKLNPLIASGREYLEIFDDPYFTIISRKNNKNNFVDVYSWTNVIKLDPQLTSLWYKITNLQKVYHLYKMNLINSKSAINGNVTNNKSAISNPLSKKVQHEINEVDFTYSSSQSPSTANPNNSHKCPVIECNFSFMVEDGKTPIPAPTSTVASTSVDHQKLTEEGCPYHDIHDLRKHREQTSQHDLLSHKGKAVLVKLQSLWASALGLVRGNEKLNYKQLCFLIDFYFNNDMYNIESRNLLNFFKIDIQNVVRKNGDNILLNLFNGGTKNIVDDDLFARLNAKGVYLSMLALIIEESLDILRSNIKVDMQDDMSINFRSLFPTEVVYLSLGYKGNNVLSSIEEFFSNMTDLRSVKSEKLMPSLSCIACCITLLNREILVFKKQDLVSNMEQGFATVFKLLLKAINDGDALEIWKDPELIIFRCNESNKRNKGLKFHLCNVWASLLRIINLISFNIVPLLKHPEEISGLLEKIYFRIEECQVQQYHLNYVSNLKSVKYSGILVTFHIHYLISRIYCSLSRGILIFGEPKLSVSAFEGLIDECNTWLNDEGLKRLGYVRETESKLILSYLRFYLCYVVFLQDEEASDDQILNSRSPDIFTYCCQFIEYLRTIILTNSDSIASQYILSGITEILTRFIQSIIGLWVRVRDNKLKSSQKLSLSDLVSKFDNKISLEQTDVEKFMKDQIIGAVDDIIVSLNKKNLLEKEKAVKLTKLWNFYVTIIKNLQRMISINYSKIHRNVPGFKDINSESLDKCPVLSKPSQLSGALESNNGSIGSKKLSNCPISHITAPMEETSLSTKDINPKKCPINLEVLMSTTIPPDSNKRRFLFDHTSLNRHNSPQSFNAIESNIRGDSTKKQKLEHPIPSKDKMSDLIAASSMAQFSTSNVIVDDVSVSSSKESKTIGAHLTTTKESALQNSSVNWQEFNDFDFDLDFDFDFDFLQNEALFEHFNPNSDSVDPSVEEYFQ